MDLSQEISTVENLLSHDVVKRETAMTAALHLGRQVWIIASALRDRLSPEERDFVELVRQSPGAKLNGGEAFSDDDLQVPLWEVPERLRMIRCVGSYKWIPEPAEHGNGGM